MNQLKSKVHLSNFLDKMGVKTVTAYTDEKNKSAFMNCFARKITNLSTAKNEHCSSDVCHRYVVLKVCHRYVVLKGLTLMQTVFC